MQKRFPGLGDLNKATLEPRRSGQPQSDESVQRDRKFAEHAAAIEKLKKTRLSKTDPLAPTVKAPKAKAPKRKSGG
jgi:hypothetical protein